MPGRPRILAGSLAAMVMLFNSAGAAANDYWQCVPFARLISGVEIYGDARTWWSQAVGHYDTGYTPKTGAVLCFKPTGRMRLGHVAVVSQVLTDRVIQISHANWSVIEGSRGKIERNVTVIDVSPAGDWSLVKVWWDPSRELGTTTYPTYGFIYGDGKRTAQDQALAAAQTATNRVVGGVRPGASPMAMLGQIADSTDRIAALIEMATGSGAPQPKK